MSGSLVGRVLRPVVLLVAGLFIAQATAIGLSGDRTTAATTQTRVASCHGLDFHPINTTTEVGYMSEKGRLLVRRDKGEEGDEDGYFLCRQDLPHRAVVTKVQFTLYDDSGLGELRYCALVRAGLTTALADDEPQVLAQVSSTGILARPKIVRKGDSTISHATIDNAKWAYWLQCQINAPGAITDLAGIYGANVTYKISSANG